MFFRDMLLYGILLFLVLYITRINNMWGVKKGVTKAKVDKVKERAKSKKRDKYTRILNVCVWFAKNIGFGVSDAEIEDYKYKIDRLGWRISVLDRAIRPLELIGVIKIFSYSCCFIGINGIILTRNILFNLFFLAILTTMLFKYYADMKIMDEDMEIEQDFPDLYLLLYTRLVRGVYTRLAPTLDDYITTLDVVYGDYSHKAIRKLTLDLRNNIEIYGDDGLAVHNLRNKYRSAMIVNFCNLAMQALTGIDNQDKLLAFKMELTQKRLDFMRRRAEKLVDMGKKAVMSVFIILFQFVVLSWYAKLGGGGMLSNFFM